MQHLKQANYACAAIDLTRLGNEEITVEQWYKGIYSELVRGFRLRDRCDRNWWKDRQDFSPLQRLSQFIEEILLGSPRRTRTSSQYSRSPPARRNDMRPYTEAMAAWGSRVYWGRSRFSNTVKPCVTN